MKAKKKNRYVPPKELRPVYKFKKQLDPNKKGTWIEAKYYYDHSGVIEIRHKGWPIYETESGTVSSHLEEISDKIEEMKQSIEILNSALVFLDHEYNNNMDEPFEEAEDYLASLKVKNG